MLKQSLSRNQRSKGFKVKHALQIFVLLAICIWLLYQLKHYDDKKAYEESSAKISGKVQIGHEIIELGRRGLHPRVEETSLRIGRHREKEEESEEDVDESKAEESEEEGRGGGDDEVDGHDQERAEEESEGVEDLIDEEDTERDEGSEDKENDSENLSLLDDQAQNEDRRNTQEVREEHYKGDDASSAVKQNTQTISSELEIGSLRRVKEEEVESAENIEVEKENKTNGLLDFKVDINDAKPKFGGGMTAKNAVYGAQRGNQFGSSNLDVQIYANSSNKTTEQPNMNNDSTAVMAEISDSLNGTEILPKLYHDASLTSGQRYLEAFPRKQNENPKSMDMQSGSRTTLSETNNLDTAKRELTVSTGSETENVVPEALAKLEKNYASTNTNENDGAVSNGNFNAFGRLENVEESSMTLRTNQNVDFVQNESGSLDSSFYQGDRDDQPILETLTTIVGPGTNIESAAE